MPQHTSKASYKKGSQFKEVAANSGNQPYQASTNKNALKFKRFLDELDRAPVVIESKTPDQRKITEKKYATTCSEPHAIYKALCDGADPKAISVTTTCNGEYRSPCMEFCSQYITSSGNFCWDIVADETITYEEYQTQQAQKKEKQERDKHQKKVDEKMKTLKGNSFALLALDGDSDSES